MSARYRVNGPNFASEVIDGEAVIINLEKGVYYSLRGAGAEIWTALKAGTSAARVRQQLLVRYEGDPVEITSALDDLIGEMEKEGILVAAPATNEPEEVVAIDRPTGDRPPFQRTILERFNDMEAILMLDPIHEVDQTGWPAAKPQD